MRDLVIMVHPGPGTDGPVLGLLPAVRTAHAMSRAGTVRLWLIAPAQAEAEPILRALPEALRGRATVLPWGPTRGEMEALQRVAQAGAGAVVIVPSDVVVGVDAAAHLVGLQVPAGGMAMVGTGVAVVSAEALRESAATSLDGLRRDLEHKGLMATYDTPGLVGATSDAASRRAVQEAILRGLRKPLEVEGVIGYFIQRPLTRHASRLLVRTRVHPNHVSVLAMATGVLSGVLVATAETLWTALGGVLFFTGSLLDCVDGELARLRFQCSYLGEWLDTLADDLSTLSFLAGMTLHLHTRYGSPLLDGVGAATVLEFVLASAYVYHHVATVHHRGDVTVFRYSFQRDEGASNSRLMRLLVFVVKRDFFSALFCVSALAGVVEVAFALSAMGAFGFALAVVLTALARANGTKAMARDTHQVVSS